MASISSEDGWYSVCIEGNGSDCNTAAEYMLTKFVLRVSQFPLHSFLFDGLRITTMILWRCSQKCLSFFLCKDGHMLKEYLSA